MSVPNPRTIRVYTNNNQQGNGQPEYVEIYWELLGLILYFDRWARNRAMLEHEVNVRFEREHFRINEYDRVVRDALSLPV